MPFVLKPFSLNPKYIRPLHTNILTTKQDIMLDLPKDDSIFTASVDETARGTLVGDTCAAAVIMKRNYDKDDKFIHMITDSKKLTPNRRKLLAQYIKENAVAYGIGLASVEEIDKHNILQATFLAMHRALDETYAKQSFTKIEVDGTSFKPYIPPGHDTEWLQHECVIDGDAQRLGIAAASIIAKVYRDEWIEKLCDEHPDLDEKYQLRSNKGYGTKAHMEGLKKYGPSIYHRMSFAPVAKAASEMHKRTTR